MRERGCAGVKVKSLGNKDVLSPKSFALRLHCFPLHFQITSGRQSSMSLEWKAKINLWRKEELLIKLCCCLNLLMGHSHEFLRVVWQKQKLGLKLKPKCWIFFARGAKAENNLNKGCLLAKSDKLAKCSAAFSMSGSWDCCLFVILLPQKDLLTWGAGYQCDDSTDLKSCGFHKCCLCCGCCIQ